MGRYSARRIQRSTAYKVWSYLLVLTLVSSGFLMPQGSQAVAVPSVVAQTTEPEAVVPDIPAKQETVRRTAYSKLDSNPDGSYTATFGVRPLHWLDETTGEYKPFDNTLRTATTPGYSHENTANSYKASFEQAADVAAGKPVARIEAGDTSITMTSIGANPSASNTAENRIVYAGAYPDTDLLYTVDNERVKEEIVLKATPAAVTSLAYTYDLNLKGLTATKRADNSVEFKDASGKAVFTMPAPFMVDSSGKPEVEYSDSVQVALADLGAGVLRLTLTPDLAWLTDPARVYPVTIDPTVEQVVYNGAGAQDTYILESTPNQNYSSNESLHVGKSSTGYRRNTLIQFPELDALPKDSVVTAAHLKLYAESGTDAVPMEIYANTSAWDEAKVTWNSSPAKGNYKYGSPTSSVPGWNSMWVSGLVRHWVNGSLANNGLRLMPEEATVSAGQSTQFLSSNAADSTKWPQLEVNYMPATRYGLSDIWSYKGMDHGSGNTNKVNVSTGNLVFQHEDGVAEMQGFIVGLTHIYSSQDPYGQTDYYDKAGAVYGEGWTFSQNIRLYKASGGAMVLRDEHGSTWVYAENTVQGTTQTYFRLPRYYHTLVKSTTTGMYTLTPSEGGDSFYFDAQGRLTKRENDNGQYLTYAYDDSDRLRTITDASPQSVRLDYEGPGMPARLSQITNVDGTVIKFGYGGGDLTTITHNPGTASEETTRLGYGIAHHLISVTNPSGQKSDLYYKIEHQWENAGDVDGFRAEGRATGVSQSTEHWFRGSASLKVALSDVTNIAVSSAALVPPSPMTLNSTQQELLAFVYVPGGSS
ncbi:MAG: DNRLRE domain-containing protein, partial [Chloroflexota bacterium]|nr:DNRLRE domain-containing protein [Chloroflexota bacterium]